VKETSSYVGFRRCRFQNCTFLAQTVYMKAEKSTRKHQKGFDKLHHAMGSPFTVDLYVWSNFQLSCTVNLSRDTRLTCNVWWVYCKPDQKR